MKTKLFTLLLALAANVGSLFAITIDGINYSLNYKNLTAEVTNGINYSGSIVIPETVNYTYYGPDETKTYKVRSIGEACFL